MGVYGDKIVSVSFFPLSIRKLQKLPKNVAFLFENKTMKSLDL